jgi:DeoR family transcriptional regulator of aga operon
MSINISETPSNDLTIDRRAKILEILEANGQVKVPELSALFNVSDVTIRNDLEQLEQKNLLIRTRGGALKIQRVGVDYNLNLKRAKHRSEKERIGARAAKMIKDGETIILDSGTTTMEIAKNLIGFHNLTVITNALNIAGMLLDNPDIKVIVLGGTLRRNSLSLIGAIAESSMMNYYCDKVFLGVDGIDSQHGVSTPNPEEAKLNQLMIENSKEVVIVTDSSKFLKRSFVLISGMDKIDTIVTDKKIPDDEHKKLLNLGKKVIVV